MIDRISIRVVGLFFLHSACAKLLLGYSERFFVSEPLYYAAAPAEILIAGAILTGHGRHAARMIGSWILAAGALMAAFLDIDCGCQGGAAFPATRADRILTYTALYVMTVLYRPAEHASGGSRDDGLG